MKFMLRCLFLSFFGISYSFAEPCMAPRVPICAFLSPNIAHAFIEINFKKNVSDQIVYLKGLLRT
jgi:hypothetical protein